MPVNGVLYGQFIFVQITQIINQMCRYYLRHLKLSTIVQAPVQLYAK
jgi:hypothetical protein